MGSPRKGLAGPKAPRLLATTGSQKRAPTVEEIGAKETITLPSDQRASAPSGSGAEGQDIASSLDAAFRPAYSLNVKLQPFRLRASTELVNAFEKMEQARLGAVETGDDPLSVGNVGAIVALAARGRLPSIGPEEVPRAGGVIGYGADVVAMYRHAAFFVDRIFKGSSPSDLPFERASKFQFVLNLKTARVLGLEVPTATLLRADEVIE